MSQEEQAKKTGEEIAANELSDQDLDAVAGGGPGDPIKGINIGLIKKPGGNQSIAATQPGASAKNYNESKSNTSA